MGEVTQFLGIKLSWTREQNNHFTVHLIQEIFADNLVDTAGLNDANPVHLPYRSCHTVESIPTPLTTYIALYKVNQRMQSRIGSLLWLVNTTRPDLATITSILSQYISKLTPAHARTAKYTIRYAKGTKTRGICFYSRTNNNLSAYVHFPTPPNKLFPLYNANWGSQD